MTCVVDASVVVAALTDRGDAGAWAIRRVRTEATLAPHLLSVEVVHAVRRLVRTAVMSDSEGRTAVADLLEWPLTYVDFAPVAHRVWELRDTVSSYDAWYVAVAEVADAPLITLDARLARVPGPRCAFDVGPG